VADELKALERENRELRQANEIWRKAAAYFAMGEGNAALLQAIPKRSTARFANDRVY
jgi:transposase-like protein